MPLVVTMRGYGAVIAIGVAAKGYRPGSDDVSIDVDNRLFTRLAETDDVATITDLMASGFSRSSIERRIRNGRLQSFGHGVVGLAGPADGRRQRLRAAQLAHPTGAISHRSAAVLHDLPTRDDGQVHLTIPHAASRGATEFVVHQSKHLPLADITMVAGIRTTTVCRTVSDLAPFRSLEALSWLMQWVIKEGRCSAVEMQACVRALNRRGRSGSTKRRHAVATLLDDNPLELSVLEQRFLALATRSGITDLVPQFQPPWYEGRHGIVDFAMPPRRIIVELDGRRWHSLVQDQRRDRSRDRMARAHGWFVVRYGWDEVTTRPEEVIADLCRVMDLARRAAS
jgi:predicted transcriptional regulator of viral defense system